jgi:hypothetical protein
MTDLTDHLNDYERDLTRGETTLTPLTDSLTMRSCGSEPAASLIQGHDGNLNGPPDDVVPPLPSKDLLH